MHWEIGFEGDGFPPSSFEMLLHVFNAGRLCEHEDFNFTLMAGQVEEKSSLCKVLIHLLDQAVRGSSNERARRHVRC